MMITRNYLVVGLGNPENHYSGTRHNIGFDIMNKLAEKYFAKFEIHNDWQALIAKVSLPGYIDLILAKPCTGMNLSGVAVEAIAYHQEILPNEILIIHDECDLPVGQVKIKEGGGYNGHNGVKSVIDELGFNEFYRLRIGIGSPPTGKSKFEHVLARFTAEERETALNKGYAGLVNIIADSMDFDKAMITVNRK